MDEMRTEFEQEFPLPYGIAWNGRSHGPCIQCGVHEYVGLCGVSARFDSLWQAWQAATNAAHRKYAASAMQDDSPRMMAIGQNGNNGEHYE